jgi:hypothetical protein
MRTSTKFYNETSLIWKPLPFAQDETAIFNNIKLGIIRHKRNVWTASVGNRKLADSKSKKEAVKRILEEIGIQRGYS